VVRTGCRNEKICCAGNPVDSGPTTRRLLYRVEDGDVTLVDFISRPIDWGVWSLRDLETVDPAFPGTGQGP
jgi:hypothetical protein